MDIESVCVIDYSNVSSITFTPAPISDVHADLHAIPPHLIRVYHVCNDDVIFLSSAGV